MTQTLTVAGLLLAAAAILAAFVGIVRSDRPRRAPGRHSHLVTSTAPAEEPCEVDAAEQAALDAATERVVATVAAAAAEMPAGLAPEPVDVLRTLSPRWHDLVTPPEQPQLFADLNVEPRDLLPIVPGRVTAFRPWAAPGHQPRHLDLGDGETTVEWVLPGWMPPIGARRLALLFDDTQSIVAVPDGR